MDSAQLLFAYRAPISSQHTDTRVPNHRSTAWHVQQTSSAAVVRESATCDPQFEKYTHIPRAQFLLSRALSLHADGRTREALRLFAELETYQPRDKRTLNARARIYADIGRTDLALADMNKVLQGTPKCLSTMTNRALLFAQEKKYAKALEDLECVLSIDSDFMPALSARGDVYAAMESWNRALQDYSRVLRLLGPRHRMSPELQQKAIHAQNMQSLAPPQRQVSYDLPDSAQSTQDSQSDPKTPEIEQSPSQTPSISGDGRDSPLRGLSKNKPLIREPLTGDHSPKSQSSHSRTSSIRSAQAPNDLEPMSTNQDAELPPNLDPTTASVDNPSAGASKDKKKRFLRMPSFGKKSSKS
eukprot:TRINITY_DN7965_c0_g1_i1.p1 TRINITY_DN7965_c0_g1~~TRINITY_DN7965_c0_g1_i1.p1  ORF type:complete len:357 (+),score=73.49 TRINITY_DN7965_c0_g1_i1:59-1129(+)